MFDLSKELAEELKCTTCGKYLTTLPVYESGGGKFTCGNCPFKKNHHESHIFNKLSAHLTFPCRFKNMGCPERVAPQTKHDASHENNCDYKTIECPACEQLNTEFSLISHILAHHPKLTMKDKTFRPKIGTVFNRRVFFEKSEVFSLREKLDGAHFYVEIQNLSPSSFNFFEVKFSLKGNSASMSGARICDFCKNRDFESGSKCFKIDTLKDVLNCEDLTRMKCEIILTKQNFDKTIINNQDTNDCLTDSSYDSDFFSGDSFAEKKIQNLEIFLSEKFDKKLPEKQEGENCEENEQRGIVMKKKNDKEKKKNKSVKKGKGQVVKNISEVQKSPKNTDKNKAQLDKNLLEACKFLQPIRDFLKKGANPSCCDAKKMTPLHYECINGRTNYARELLEAKANINAQNTDGDTALHLATKHNRTVIVSSLIKSKADCNLQNNNGWTALHFASYNDDLLSLKIIFQRSDDPDLKNSEGRTALMVACIKKSHTCALFLLENGANPNVSDKKKITPLHIACSNSDLIMMKILIKFGADRRFQDEDGEAPLHVACVKSDQRFLKELIENGVDLDVKNNQGDTPLHYASQRGNNWFVCVLLEKGADPNVKNKSGYVPLQLTKDSQCKELLQPVTDPVGWRSYVSYFTKQK